MKKYIFPITVSLLLGIFMSYFIISQYETSESIAVSSNATNLYYIQRGVYSTKENMNNNMKDFRYYIYNVEDNMYYTYIGISNSRDNALKIQKYYKSLGYDTYIKEKMTDNKSFITVLKQYDQLLSSTNDGNTIKVICNQILAKYEELVNGEY